jgi:hypothetical protein
VLVKKELLQSHMQYRLISYSAEASELGIRPGQGWPSELDVPGVGNGHKFYPIKRIMLPGGDLGGVVYWQRHGCVQLTIFND